MNFVDALKRRVFIEGAKKGFLRAKCFNKENYFIALVDN